MFKIISHHHFYHYKQKQTKFFISYKPKLNLDKIELVFFFSFLSSFSDLYVEMQAELCIRYTSSLNIIQEKVIWDVKMFSHLIYNQTS